MQFLPLVLVFGIVYFFMIRPQQRRAQAHRAMLEALKRNDIVATHAGFIGKIVDIDETEVGLEIAPNVVIRMLKQSIADMRPEAQKEHKKKDKKEKKTLPQESSVSEKSVPELVE